MTVPLRVDGISKSFGGVQALKDVSFVAPAGKITGLVGQNGAGKTTLINVITKQLTPDTGEVYVGTSPITQLPAHHMASAGLARTFQQLRLFANMTCLENVLLGLPSGRGESLAACLFTPGGVARQEAQDRATALSILEAYGLGDRAETGASELSYGLQKLLSLARLAAARAEIVLIDEPTSGLSGEAVERVASAVAHFRDQNKTVILVEHDMDVLFSLSDHVVVLDQGQVLCQGTPAEIRDNAQVREIYLGKGHAA